MTRYSEVKRTSVAQQAKSNLLKMKLFAAAAFISTLAFACADVSQLGYGYDQPAASAPSNQYIPPAASAPALVYSAPAPVYQLAAAAPEPVYSAPAPAPVYDPQPAASEVYEQPAEDGYRYRTVRRRVYKQRRF